MKEWWEQWREGFYMAFQFNLGERKIPGRSLGRKVWCYMRTSQLYSDSTGGNIEARRTLKELQKNNLGEKPRETHAGKMAEQAEE